MRAWTASGRISWPWFIVLALLALALPLADVDVHGFTLLAIYALFAMSLGVMWGYAGMLSFGHSAYFGLGAYVYAIAATNIGESTVPILLAVLIPALVAAAIGAMMFYGRISDVYMGVITLVVTLILYTFMRATAGDQYRIGDARLGGFNGIPAFPTFNMPGDPQWSLFGTPTYYICVVSLLLCYLMCRWQLARSFGRVLIRIRENTARAELMGYNVPAHQTGIFTLSAAMAGLAGCFFANYAEIVTPDVFSLRTAAEVIVWCMFGGVGTLLGPIFGAVALGWLKFQLGQQTLIDASLIFGPILILVVLFFPRGVVLTVIGWFRRPTRRVAQGRAGIMRERQKALAEASPLR